MNIKTLIIIISKQLLSHFLLEKTVFTQPTPNSVITPANMENIKDSEQLNDKTKGKSGLML